MTVTADRESRVVISSVGFSNPIDLDQYVENDTHIEVYADTTLLTLGVDYTIAGIGDNDGIEVTITPAGLLRAPALWVVYHNPPLDQGADLSLGGQFGLAFEQALDAVTRRFQSVADRMKRSLSLPLNTPTDFPELTLPAPNPGRSFKWNEAGDGLIETLTDPDDTEGVLAIVAGSLAAAAAAAASAAGSAITATTQAALATTNGAAQVALATAQVVIATAQAVAAAASAAAALVSQNSATTSASTATTQAGTATTQAGLAAASAAAAVANQALPGRLSLTTGDPTPVADVVGGATLYYVQYIGNSIPLYSGSVWNARSIGSQISLSLTGLLTNGRPHDVWIYDNAGTPTLEVTAWTNDTARATALARQDGILVKSGAVTRRYVGTIYATGTGTTEDSKAKRFVWNYANRIRRSMSVVEATNTWNYTVATLRQANGAVANQLDYVCGLDSDAVEAQVTSTFINSSGSIPAGVAVGLDSTTAAAAGSTMTYNYSVSASGSNQPRAEYRGNPGIGRHFLAWLEQSTATGTCTWQGDTNTPTVVQSGIIGSVMA